MATETIQEHIAANAKYREILNAEAKKRGMIKSVMLRRALDAYFFGKCGAKIDQADDDNTVQSADAQKDGKAS